MHILALRKFVTYLLIHLLQPPAPTWGSSGRISETIARVIDLMLATPTLASAVDGRTVSCRRSVLINRLEIGHCHLILLCVW